VPEVTGHNASKVENHGNYLEGKRVLGLFSKGYVKINNEPYPNWRDGNKSVVVDDFKFANVSCDKHKLLIPTEYCLPCFII
uniref:Uncharacterized protein n=1 Tax=Romanomermis culicivorax TaxID=13658 RepID=A0A915KA69_ROMCU